MTIEKFNETIELLRDDDNYFGELGKKYLSNSDIKNLVHDPDLYGKPWDDKADFLKGKYLHYRVLQPELKEPMIIVDAATRNTTIYKDTVAEHSIEGMPKPIFLLKKEVVELDYLADRVEMNDTFVDGLQAHKEPFEVEEPMIGELLGYWFKGKADRINKHRGFIADFKTTKSLSSFVSNFRTYGYHGQAYIYSKLFGLPVRFFVICKATGRLGVFDVSDETLADAEVYITTGLDRLEYYYGKGGTGKIDQYYSYSTL